MIYASSAGRLEAVKLLLDCGADVNAKDDDGCTALIYSYLDGDEGIVKVLLDYGADFKA